MANKAFTAEVELFRPVFDEIVNINILGLRQLSVIYVNLRHRAPSLRSGSHILSVGL